MAMQTVIETKTYLSSAKAAGMTEDEMVKVVNILAANPSAGDVIVGSGGCRKVRIAGRNKGKSGGYRIITFFYHEGAPLILLWALSKGQEANVSDAQIKGFADIAKTLRATMEAPKKG